MPTFKITLAYDGTPFVGWQRQASGTSIQGLLEDALRELDNRDVTLVGAGRTDAGVHALGQVATFSLERTMAADTVMRALNARLPAELRVVSAEEAAETFHARFGARRKTYRYRIWNAEVLSPFERQYAWHLTGALDVDRMAEAARRLEGRHDFAAFQAAGAPTSTTDRVISLSRIVIASNRPTAEGTEDTEDTKHKPPCGAGFGLDVHMVLGGGALIVYEITGDGFLRHMVRNIVGTLVEIGRGRRGPAWIDDVLALRDRARGGPTAPAQGLILVRVEYGDL